jgi:chromosome segregation ATPase
VRADHVPAERLDSALKRRLRDVLGRDSVTEAELRAVAEQGRACTLILRGLIDGSRTRLDRLSADPASSLAEVAAAYRAISDLQPDLDELEALMTALDARSHELRARWVGR